MRTIQLIIIALAFLTGCAPASETVIFLSKDTGVSRIYSIDQHKEISIISLNDGKALYPTLSPDFTKLAYLSEELGAWDIRIRTLGSAADTNITYSAQLEGPPAWSPDGNAIAYMSLKGKNRDIFVYDLMDGNLRQVTFNEAIDVDPVWSESLNNTLYYKSLRAQNEEIYQITLNDSLVRKISSTPGSNTSAQIIPGQHSLSYVHYSDGIYQLLSYSEKDQSTEPLLTATERIKSYEWSANGQYLAVDFEATLEIYQQTESGLVFLEDIENGELPAWSKSGLKLFYNLNDAAGAQVFVYDMDQNTVESITPISFNAYGALPLN